MKPQLNMTHSALRDSQRPTECYRLISSQRLVHASACKARKRAAGWQPAARICAGLVVKLKLWTTSGQMSTWLRSNAGLTCSLLVMTGSLRRAVAIRMRSHNVQNRQV